MFKKIFEKKSQNKTNSTFSNNHEIWFNQDEIKNHIAFFETTGKGKTSNLVEMEIIARKKALRKKILHF